MMGNSLTKAAAIDFGVQWTCWLIAAVLKTEKFYDLAGSGTFLFLAYLSLQWGKRHHLRQRLQTGMVSAWAIRLGLYLFTRILKDGADRRFNNVRDVPLKFLAYWTIQGVWVFMTMLPTLILNSKQVDRPLSWRDYIGWGLWGIGFVFEAIADFQKSQFRNNPDNQGQFISHGLWSLCRHPNYFGEILMWTGLYISASSVMSGLEYASVISPVFVTFLLTHVSGIPLLEKMGMKRYGTDPAYLEYIRRTPKLIPFLW